MKVDVALLPSLLDTARAQDWTIVVFDVLRATSTMTAALAAGIREIRVFDTLSAARQTAGCEARSRCPFVNSVSGER